MMDRTRSLQIVAANDTPQRVNQSLTPFFPAV